jgi:hypothetical protein
MAGATATPVVVLLALTDAVARTEFEEDIDIHSHTLRDCLRPKQPQFSTFKRQVRRNRTSSTGIYIADDLVLRTSAEATGYQRRRFRGPQKRANRRVHFVTYVTGHQRKRPMLSLSEESHNLQPTFDRKDQGINA